MSWRVAKSLLTLRDQYNSAYPGRSKAHDGTIGDLAHSKTKSDHNPDANGVVKAMDLTATGAIGATLANAVIRTMLDRGQTGYVIHAGRIANPSIQRGAWRVYTGANPHNVHVHVSVHSQIDSTAPWAYPPMTMMARPTGGVAIALPSVITPGDRTRGPFPLPARHYYGVNDKTVYSHSGVQSKDRAAIRQIQAVAGVHADGYFGAATAKAVKVWQGQHKLTADAMVGEKTWNAMGAKR